MARYSNNKRNSAIDDAQIALFLAKNGATKIPEGEATMNNDDWYRATRSATPFNKQDDLINQRIVSGYDHLGRAIIVNGIGELVAIE